jgi:hypothetical protein
VAKVVALKQEDPGILLSNFAAHLAGRDIKPSNYAGDVRRFADWVARKYGDFSSASVSTLDVVDYRANLQAAGKAPATVNRTFGQPVGIF